jgi:threonine synthase
MRYAPFLPIFRKSHLINPTGTEFPTELRRSKRLGGFLGLRNLWIKDETKNPTKTFKIRDALVTLSRFQELGVTEFAMSSTGNTARAFSYVMLFARTHITCHIFFPEWAVVDLDQKRKKDIETIVVNDDYNKTIETARRYSQQMGITLEGGFSNPCRIEANKTIAYEIGESGLEPDWYVQAVTTGSGVYGFYKGFNELRMMGVAESMPRILCVQPDRCAPMVTAFRGGRKKIAAQDVVAHPDTFATTLTNGNPAFSYPYLRRAVLDTKGTFESVDERDIAHAFLLLTKLEGIIVDPAAATALAGIIKASGRGDIEKDEIVVLNLSGSLNWSPS